MRWRKLTSCTGSRKNSNLIIYLAVVSEPFSRSWRERSKFIHNFRLLTAGHVFYFRVRQFFIHEPWAQRVGMVCCTHVLSQSLPAWKISPHTSCLISRDEQTVVLYEKWIRHDTQELQTLKHEKSNMYFIPANNAWECSALVHCLPNIQAVHEISGMIAIQSSRTGPQLLNCFLTWGSGDQIQNFVIRVFHL